MDHAHPHFIDEKTQSPQLSGRGGPEHPPIQAGGGQLCLNSLMFSHQVHRCFLGWGPCSELAKCRCLCNTIRQESKGLRDSVRHWAIWMPVSLSFLPSTSACSTNPNQDLKVRHWSRTQGEAVTIATEEYYLASASPQVLCLFVFC